MLLARLPPLPGFGVGHLLRLPAPATGHKPPQITSSRLGCRGGLDPCCPPPLPAAWRLVLLVQLPGALLVALGERRIDPLAAVGQLLPRWPRLRARLRHLALPSPRRSWLEMPCCPW